MFRGSIAGRRHVVHGWLMALRDSHRAVRTNVIALGVCLLLVSVLSMACDAGGTKRADSSRRETVRPTSDVTPAVVNRDMRNCVAIPSACGYPDQTNTGVPANIRLISSGSITASREGQVIDGMNVTGEVVVTASNVTIKNSRVTGGRGAGSADWVIVIRPGVKNLTVADSEILTPPGTAQDIACILNIGDAKPVIRRVNIHGCSAGVSSGGGSVEDSYFHDMSQVAGLSHNVGIASNGGGGMTIRRNTVFNQFSQTAAIAFYQDFSAQSDNLVEDNFVSGGSYCFYGGTGSRGRTSNIRFVNNRLTRHFFPNCGVFGPIASFSIDDPGNLFVGNYWDDNGETVTP
ncbi:hypothetical protein GORHZ_050_00045 [Gordonia rhizosphera NBRC 16068]|uniref:Right handed beta helix domain-containing protein n=1 Tax=Gordonia rhizosphera NBRC 16068 TaxID=1108045 RepID=K6UZW1_9ACTN|nr:hypothetical protein GORHZ_050_00045 [Gordonia rhizosphera NBRC 16068]